MKEPIITHKNVRDKICLEGEYKYDVLLTIGLVDGGDFYIFLEFINLKWEDYETLAQLSKTKKTLSIESKFLSKEEYNITHIVVMKFSTDTSLAMKWECLSDDPSFSLIIE